MLLDPQILDCSKCTLFLSVPSPFSRTGHRNGTRVLITQRYRQALLLLPSILHVFISSWPFFHFYHLYFIRLPDADVRFQFPPKFSGYVWVMICWKCMCLCVECGSLRTSADAFISRKRHVKVHSLLHSDVCH